MTLTRLDRPRGTAGRLRIPFGARHRRGVSAAALTLTLALTLAGCTGSAEEAGGADATEEAASSAAAAESTSSTTPAETATPDAEAEPADAAGPSESADTPETGTDDGVLPGDGGEPAAAVPEDRDDTDDVAPPAFAAPDTVAQEDAFDGASLTVSAVEVSADTDHDRVTYHLDGNGFPGWSVEYVDVDDTSLGGVARSALEVVISGVVAVDARDPQDGAGDVVEVGAGGSEGRDATFYIGLAGDHAPFRVYLQHTPERLVVDIEHGS